MGEDTNNRKGTSIYAWMRKRIDQVKRTWKIKSRQTLKRIMEIMNVEDVWEKDAKWNVQLVSKSSESDRLKLESDVTKMR